MQEYATIFLLLIAKDGAKVRKCMNKVAETNKTTNTNDDDDDDDDEDDKSEYIQRSFVTSILKTFTSIYLEKRNVT